MATYVGFSTINANQPRYIKINGVDGGMGGVVNSPRLGKKYRLTDDKLVIRDFVNAFNIKQGDKVGQPGYGTNIWNFVFDPNTADVREQVENEIRRVAGLDPRLTIGSIGVFSHDHGILIELQMVISPYNNEVQFEFFLNKSLGLAQQR